MEDFYKNDALVLFNIIGYVNSISDINEISSILSILCNYVIDINDNDITEDNKLKEYTEGYNESIEIYNNYIKGNLYNYYKDLLSRYEMYEILSELIKFENN